MPKYLNKYFITASVHRRSEAVLCMMYKISCNTIHPLYGALPVLYVPVRVTRSANLFAEGPRSAAVLLFSCQYLWIDLADTVLDGEGPRAGPMLFYW